MAPIFDRARHFFWATSPFEKKKKKGNIDGEYRNSEIFLKFIATFPRRIIRRIFQKFGKYPVLPYSMIIELIINRDRGKKKREERRGMNETADFSSDDRYNGRRGRGMFLGDSSVVFH